MNLSPKDKALFLDAEELLFRTELHPDNDKYILPSRSALSDGLFQTLHGLSIQQDYTEMKEEFPFAE